MNVYGVGLGDPAGDPRVELARSARAAARANLVERDRAAPAAAPSINHAAQRRQLIADGIDLGHLRASSQTITTDSEFPATHAHSSGELVG